MQVHGRAKGYGGQTASYRRVPQEPDGQYVVPGAKQPGGQHDINRAVAHGYDPFPARHAETHAGIEQRSVKPNLAGDGKMRQIQGQGPLRHPVQCDMQPIPDNPAVMRVAQSPVIGQQSGNPGLARRQGAIADNALGPFQPGDFMGQHLRCPR
ncbi:hypothetical protein ABK905_09920 [Acerihabitans sp. KWT182]|uniref:Uncharacterized protein n=1 Tax=Acerihabitans sp. KWT182 TaxID=3157919 RepID=A0AAU7QF04_9GAMM